MSKRQPLCREIPYPRWAFNPRIRECWLTGPTVVKGHHKSRTNPARRR